MAPDGPPGARDPRAPMGTQCAQGAQKLIRRSGCFSQKLNQTNVSAFWGPGVLALFLLLDPNLQERGLGLMKAVKAYRKTATGRQLTVMRK